MSNTTEAGKRDASHPRQPKKLDLMGVAEVADELGIRVQNLQFVKGLPEPVSQLRSTRVWLARDIRAFARREAQRKQAKRPAKAAA